MNRNIKKYFKKIIIKAVESVLIIAVLSSVVFVMANKCPGDPLRSYYGEGIERMSEQEKQLARENMGLDKPVTVQYFAWAKNFLKGDMGISFKYKQPVITVIQHVWMNTLVLGLLSAVLTFTCAVLIGCFCALHEGSKADRVICRAGVISSSIPTFFMALMLILIFAVNMKILPAGGVYSYGEKNNIVDRLAHLVLPTAVMVIEHVWYYAYMIRNKLMEEARKDYVLLYRAEGLSSLRIITGPCIRNILPSILTVIAIAVPHILGGTYVVETVFGYTGIGTLIFESAMYKDYNMLMALTIITGIVVVFFNFAAQILSEYIDPRMKYEEVYDG